MILRSACFAIPLLGALFLSGCDRVKLGAKAGGPGGRAAAAPVAAAGNNGTPDTPSAAAPAALPAAVAGGSPHFNHVLSKLDVGGKVLEFEDHEGRREWMVEAVKAVLETIPEAQSLNGVDPGAFVDATGLANVVASGKSLKRDGDSWLLRQYSYIPEGHKGLAQLIGKQPMKFRSPALIPAATDLVVETRLDGSSLPGMIQAIAKACGKEQQAVAMLKEPSPGGDTLGQLMAKCQDLQVILGIDISSWKAAANSPQAVDFILQVDGAADLLKVFLPELEKGMGKPTVQGKRRGWEFPFQPLGQPKAQLLFDDQGTLVVTSRAEYLNYVETAAMKLGEWKEFKGATDHFPENGNLLIYASPQVPVALGWIMKSASKRADDPMTGSVLTKAADYLEAKPWALCVACEPDGVSTLAEMPMALNAELGSALPVLTGTSVLFVGARAWKKGSDRAACVMNTRNVQQAIRGHQNMKGLKPGDPIDWNQIFGEGKLLDDKPHCPSGKYTLIKTIPKLGKLACTCSDPDHAVNPDVTKDW